MSMEIFAASPSHVSTKYTVLVQIKKSRDFVEILQWDTLISKPSTPHGHQLGGDKIVNAPLSCYIVKWRNIKVAITGLVQLSNLISSYNGNKNLL